MESAWPGVVRDKPPEVEHANSSNRLLSKKINNEKDVILFKTTSPAYINLKTFINLLCEKIFASGNKTLNHKYQIQNEIFHKCSELLDELARLCDETDLTQAKGSAPLRFGHIAFRDWFDLMRVKCKEFIYTQLIQDGHKNEQYSEELLCYLSESFGNKMRIDYGTGHELSFIIFTMGLSNLINRPDRAEGGDDSLIQDYPVVTQERLKVFVNQCGWDILALFAHKYLRLCRRIQTKFRLEPAGSRGVYNMDDFQYLPFLFGAAQLSGTKYIAIKDFHLPDNADMYKRDFMFFEAVDFILNNKRGPFHEHSYTLWCFTDLGSWDNIYRRIKMKFTDDVLGPFPIVQHILFGKYILRWDPDNVQ